MDTLDTFTFGKKMCFVNEVVSLDWYGVANIKISNYKIGLDIKLCILICNHVMMSNVDVLHFKRKCYSALLLKW